ncbi:MAG: class I SAM-dependent methyltransferase [Candidatus Omnitrophica bacterium]|nr:class I SAM-dependent methyltransferase [Candidatus Omnitrophota bacterium]
MPTIEENKKNWETYHWNTQGDKWSEAWGSVDLQWFGTLLPRFHKFVPTGTILEIAPGYGRWTHYLKDQCQQLIIVDLVEKCISSCKERFKDCPHITYHVNDGKSLAMISDNSIDFVFSFDSLVHVEEEVIREYLKQISLKLKKNGVGFIHHSNLGNYKDYLDRVKKLPMKKILNKLKLIDTETNWRAVSMTAEKFNSFAKEYGLECISQECIPWGKNLLSDCMSIFTKKDSIWVQERKQFNNPLFLKESNYLSRLAKIYDFKIKP